MLYEYNYRPYEEKNVKTRKERENVERLQKGIKNPPSMLHKRFINRMFDSRKTHIVPENVRPMPLPDGSFAPSTRDQVMQVGLLTTIGGLKIKDPE